MRLYMVDNHYYISLNMVKSAKKGRDNSYTIELENNDTYVINSNTHPDLARALDRCKRLHIY